MKRAIFGSLATLSALGLFAAQSAVAEEDFAVAGPEAVPMAMAEFPPDGEYPVLEGQAVLEAGEVPVAHLGGLVPGACGNDYACDICGGGCCPPPTWYLRNGVRVLAASKVRNIELTREFVGVQEIANGGGDEETVDVFVPRMTTKSVDFDVAAGYAVTVGRYLGQDCENRDLFLEFAYWGMNHWQTGRQVTGERVTRSFFLDPEVEEPTPITFGALYSPFERSIGGFNRADLHQIDYDLEVHNWEVNVRFVPRSRPDRLVLHPSGHWRRECTPGEYFSFLAGIRGMSLREGFLWSASGVVTVDEVDNPVSAEYRVLTHNDLVGIQIGGEYTIRECRWHYGARIKAGPYMNFADQRSRAESQAAGDPLAATPLDFVRRKRRDDAALIGEFGFFASYRLRPNFVFNASYDFMWVTGLARAPEQLMFQEDPPVALNTNGHTYFHGLTLGLQWVW